MIGYIASVLSIVAALPQIIQIIKTRDTAAISAVRYWMMFIGCGLWFIHGMTIQDVPIIASSSLNTMLNGYILLCKLKSMRAERQTEARACGK